MKKWMMYLSVLILVMSAGCVKVEQTLTLNADGSGSLDMMYGMSEESIEQMEAMQAMAANMPDGEGMEGAADSFAFDESTIREEFEKLEQKGVELQNVSSNLKDGWKYMNLSFSFEDLEALSKTDFFKNSSIKITKTADGNYELTQSSAQMDNGMGQGMDGMDEATKNMVMQQMMPMYKGMRIAMKLKLPGKILDSNATKTEGDTVAWVYDVDADPDSIMSMGSEPMKVTFEGKGVDLPEIDIQAEGE